MTEFELFIAEFLSELEDATFSLNFATSGLGVLVYILQALALYTVAKRRGINKPWLAWIPLANVWILGSISDQYQYVVKGQVKNKRKSLLGLNIAITAITFIILSAVVWMFIDMMFIVMDTSALFEPISEDTMEMLVSNLAYYVGNNAAFLILLSILAILAIPLMVLAVIQTVIFYMAMYDLYRSCEPNNSTLYLVLSLVGNVVIDGAYSIFMVLCKDKDLGMPPRKPEPEVIPARPTVGDPWDNVSE